MTNHDRIAALIADAPEENRAKIDILVPHAKGGDLIALLLLTCYCVERPADRRQERERVFDEWIATGRST